MPQECAMALLEVHGLSKRYGAISVADDLNLSLDPGPCLVVSRPIAAGLTEREVEQLVTFIGTLKASHAIIWIEHIPYALKAVADRIMVLHFGKKVLEGPPADVMTSRVVREIYMGFAGDDVT